MNVDLDKVVVENNETAQQFEARVGRQLAIVEYQLIKGGILFSHTEVHPALAGQGIANKLAHTALEYARAQQLNVVPLCPFVASYIRRHLEYLELVDPPFRTHVQNG